MTRILIVDDHEPFRTSVRSLLEAEGYDVVGEAADGARAVSEADRLRPDVVLLDVQLPDMDGFEVARRLNDASIGQVVILISSREASDYGHEVERAPASGFIGKSELSGALIASMLSAR